MKSLKQYYAVITKKNALSKKIDSQKIGNFINSMVPYKNIMFCVMNSVLVIQGAYVEKI
jgi:hypothetical protein